MRRKLVKRGEEHLRYEIREIVEIANEIVRRGVPMTWENIGDPVAKGERLPGWMKLLVEEAVRDDRTYAYAATKGDLEARHFILQHYGAARAGCTVEDVVFFNGLGEAINKIFANLPSTDRVIGPNPTYPSHATAEAMHHGGHHLTYPLRLDAGGRIDLDDLERQVRENDHIVGILVINPNNPLGVIHPREDLEAVVRIARDHGCFLVFDEIYQHLAFEPGAVVPLAEIVGDVPAISMKGVSKELPWPGSRCGWIEVYNGDRDAGFRDYVNTIVVSKMLEVCSTTLPQVVFPKIVAHPEFRAFLQARIDKYRRRAAQALEIFAGCAQILPVVPQGVFYLSARFDGARFPRSEKLAARNAEVRGYVDGLCAVQTLRRDKIFAYELMGAEGVCVVPLSGFGSPHDGFRMTLLEADDAVFEETCRRIRRGAEAFFRP